jgi:hypothetical protein
MCGRVRGSVRPGGRGVRSPYAGDRTDRAWAVAQRAVGRRAGAEPRDRSLGQRRRRTPGPGQHRRDRARRRLHPDARAPPVHGGPRRRWRATPRGRWRRACARRRRGAALRRRRDGDRRARWPSPGVEPNRPRRPGLGRDGGDRADSRELAGRRGGAPGPGGRPGHHRRRRPRGGPRGHPDRDVVLADPARGRRPGDRGPPGDRAGRAARGRGGRAGAPGGGRARRRGHVHRRRVSRRAGPRPRATAVVRRQPGRVDRLLDLPR